MRPDAILVLAMNLLFSALKRFYPKSLRPDASESSATIDSRPKGPSDDLARVAAVIAATRSHILTHNRG